jgi:DNA-directed RNA polymerase subunit RPC12/RpoP
MKKLNHKCAYCGSKNKLFHTANILVENTVKKLYVCLKCIGGLGYHE